MSNYYQKGGGGRLLTHGLLDSGEGRENYGGFEGGRTPNRPNSIWKYPPGVEVDFFYWSRAGNSHPVYFVLYTSIDNCP